MKRLLPPPLFFSVRLPTLLAMFWRAHLSRAAHAAVSPKERLSFLIFRLDALGDVVLTTPLFRALKQAHPGSRCTVVVQQRYKPLLVTNPHIDEILTPPRIRPQWLPQGVRRLLAAVALYWTQLRKRRFDYAISPRWDVDEHLATFLCLLTNATRRVGYSETASPAKQRANRGFDRAYDICLPPGGVRHEVVRNLAIAEALGATAAGAALEVHLTECDRRKAAKLLARLSDSGILAGVGIGAQSPGRRWPIERYAKALNRLSKDHGVQAVIACSASELGHALELERLLQRPPIVLSGAPLREVCAVLERCELFLGNDSGCAHLAAAMSCRTIVISRHPRDGDPNHFNSPLRFAPHCLHARVLQPVTGKDQCRAFCAHAEPHCITQISVDEVVASAQAMLNEARPLVLPTRPKIWSEQAARGLLHAHSAEAVRRVVEALFPTTGPPPRPA